MSVKASAERVQELVFNYGKIAAKVAEFSKKYSRDEKSVQLLAVSKFKPASDIAALYEHLHVRSFGENYVQELVEKSAVLPRDIEWHFIGNLQSNKIKELASKVENLKSVQSICEIKKAQKLNNYRDPSWNKVNVYMQINTSEEPQKEGVSHRDTDKILEFVNFVEKECPNLAFKGFMTIGSVLQSKSGELNEDFVKLVELRRFVAEKLGKNVTELELSMGMSSDFETAIKQGSNMIRIGTNIFGARDYSKKN